MKISLLRLIVCFVFCFAVTTLHGQDWPALRGSKGDGVGKTSGLQLSGGVNLKVAWKKKLGSGYSSVSIAGDSAYTMYSSGVEDKLGCFDIKTGDTKWEFTLDKRFKGENGSFDGPISTPLIHDGNIYGLSCQGRLVCVDAASGELIWEKSLTESFEVEQPMYGFSTSPIIADGNLVLQVGAKDAMLVAMDPKSGDVKWSCGNDSINSQIPQLVETQGVSVVLAAGAKKLTGVIPASGDIVFELEHGGGNGSAVMPVAIGDDNVLITVDDGYSKSVNLRPIDDQKIAASEQWQERSIKNTYNVPTLCHGNLFAFSTRILTCVDPKTGKPRWKSRKPGDGFLIAFDDKIAIITKKGKAHLINATAEKYDEVASLDVFEDLVWTIPAFSDNAIFIRSLGELARIDIVADNANTEVAADASSLPMSEAFSTFLNSIRGKDSAAANRIADEFVLSNTSFPIVDSGVAHFIYRGPENDVALASDVFGARQERKMLRAGNSDLKYYTMKLEDDQRANYVFLVNFEPQTDALNPRKATSSMYAGEMEFAVRLRNEEPLEMSWFAMDGWKEPEYLGSLPEELYGEMVEQSLPGEGEAPELDLDVYLPPEYDDETKRFPVIYILPHMKFESSQFIESADNLFASKIAGIQPAIIVVPKGRLMPKTELKLVELIDGKYRTIANRKSRSIAGFGFSGDGVFAALASSNNLFGAASVQSPLVFGVDGVVEAMKKVTQPTRVYLEWGRFDMHNPVENWDIRKESAAIFAVLEKHEQVSVSGGMVNDSADWASWKNRYDKVLRVLTAAPAKEDTSTDAAESTLMKFTTKQDHQHMKTLLGIKKLRSGRSPKADAPNAANFDEAKANPYPVLPHLMMLTDGTEVTNPDDWWNKRRPEIMKGFEYEVYGKVPDNAPSVAWEVVRTEEKTVGKTKVIERELNGKVDNSVCPEIDVNISMVVATPKDAKGKVPVLMMHTFTGAEPFMKKWRDDFKKRFPDREFGPPPGFPTAEKYLVARGWGYAKISPYSIQADSGEGLTRGIIGLCNKGQPRTQYDWGALRAWAWGASRGLDYLETDPTVDSNRVGIEGVSRFGKAAFVTMAFDKRFAAVLVGSSGKGGATLLRRNFGEAVENLTGQGGYHWMAGGFLKYGSEDAKFGNTTASNLPVDSHQLIALCAPRPTFISYGIPEKGDALWLDQRGSFMAAIAAQPAFRLLGAKGLGRSDDYLIEEMPAVKEGLLDGQLAWRQHDGGHTDLPNIVTFIEWADKFYGRVTPKPIDSDPTSDSSAKK